MKKVFYSDIAAIPSDVCPSSLDENLEPVDPNNTAHKWEEPNDNDSRDTACDCGGDNCGFPVIRCVECGAAKDDEE